MSDEPVPKRKKGVRNDVQYKRNVVKNAKVRGDEHINWKGRVVAARNDPDTIDRSCCKKNCLQEITPPELLDDILLAFYEMNTKNEQDLHLQRLMEVYEVQRTQENPGVAEERRKPKTKTLKYYLLVNRKRTCVCKTAFMNAHKVTSKRIRRIANLLELDIQPKDLRGKNTSANIISAPVCRQIHNHIDSFPTKEAHYTSRSVTYLSAELSVRKMHKLFLLKHPELTGTVNYQFYWNYFRLNFSLTFGRPVVDSCSECEALKIKIKSNVLNDIAKRVAIAELLVHKKRSKKFYLQLQQSKKLATDNPKILGLCFDFMAVVDLPRISVQEVYYFRQLSVNTFGIYDIKTDKMMSYVYHEGLARKTPDDVCSFLLHYLHTFINGEYDELHLFCDNCGGQNKNHAIVRMLMALTELRKFKKIKLHFPIRGHSYLPCDRSFGLIKRKLKQYERLYTVNEYTDKIIIQASEIQDKMSVYNVESSMVFDFQNWFPTYYFRNKLSEERLQNNRRQQFLISQYHYFEFDAETPNSVLVKDFIGGFLELNFRLRKPNVRGVVVLPNQRIYNEKIPILENKMQDLKNLARYIAPKALVFWDQIYAWPTENVSARAERVNS